MKKINRPKFITIEEAAKIARVSTRTIYRWVDYSYYVSDFNRCWSAPISLDICPYDDEMFTVIISSDEKIWIDKDSFIKALKCTERL